MKGPHRRGINRNDLINRAYELAYNFLLAVFPMLLFLLGLLGMFAREGVSASGGIVFWAVLFSLVVVIACLWRPQWGGVKIETSWEERIRLLPDLLPPLVLLMVVIGAIFFGIATATESAAVGIVGALAITASV